MTITTTAEDQNDHSNLGKKIRFITRKPTGFQDRPSLPSIRRFTTFLSFPAFSELTKAGTEVEHVPEHFGSVLRKRLPLVGYRLRRTQRTLSRYFNSRFSVRTVACTRRFLARAAALSPSILGLSSPKATTGNIGSLYPGCPAQQFGNGFCSVLRKHHVVLAGAQTVSMPAQFDGLFTPSCRNFAISLAFL